MPLTVYGNRLPLGAPVNLQVDVEGLEKLYCLTDVNRHSQVAASLITGPVVEQPTPAHKGENVSLAKKNRSAT